VVTTGASITGTAETPYHRRPDPGATTPGVLAEAARQALDDARLGRDEIDGLAVSSLTLRPDRAIDVAVRLGLRLRWIMDAGTAGASGVDMLQHAVRAVEAGDAAHVLLVAGDVFGPGDFRSVAENYNRATRDHLSGIPSGGPNGVFALVTRRHMLRHGLTRADYGRLVVTQRAWASGNPNAVYRSPLTLEEYLRAPMVADPLCLFDCVPVVSGANAIVVSAGGDGVRMRALGALHNADRHEGDGLSTGLREMAPRLWEDAAAGPSEMDVVSAYDDYPSVVLVQLEDLGFGTPPAVLEAVAGGQLALNTGGGQLSAGQAGAAGGLHGLVEAVEQLRGRGGSRQVDGARLALVTGYGMVAYRHGACANAAVLEAP
jgi:acetyl-CoA acetyltransferase